MVNDEVHKNFLNSTGISPKASPSLKDDYELVSIGRKGGYSNVEFMKSKYVPSVEFAVKGMPKVLKERNFRTIILHELHVLNKLDHPSIIKYIDSYETQDKIFGVLERSHGYELGEYLEFMEPGYSNKKLKIMYLISKAVAYLKNENIVHRDLKLPNIMVKEEKDCTLGYSIQLIDFGFAKDNGMDKNIGGSPKYMAPEAITHNSSFCSDVWSLGVLFYKMIGGEYPFDGEDNEDLFDAITYDYLSFNPKRVWVEAPYSVIELIMEMLEKDPDKRIDIFDVCSHPGFNEIRKLIKDTTDLSMDEVKKMRKFNSLPKFSKRLLSFSSQLLPSKSRISLRDKFLMNDVSNFGYIPVFPKLDEKYASSTLTLPGIPNGAATVDTMNLGAKGGRSKVSRLSTSEFVAALSDPKELGRQAVADFVFNVINVKEKGKLSAKEIGSCHIWNNGEECMLDLESQLPEEPISREWMRELFKGLMQKLS